MTWCYVASTHTSLFLWWQEYLAWYLNRFLSVQDNIVIYVHGVAQLQQISIIYSFCITKNLPVDWLLPNFSLLPAPDGHILFFYEFDYVW
jgi:hypothetical protein